MLELARFQVIEPAKAWLRVKLHQRQLQLINSSTVPIQAGPVLIATIRDEVTRLPYFLSYYRSIGVKHFIFIDNQSEDDSTSYLVKQEDVILYKAVGSYKKARYGNDWINFLLAKHCVGRWIIYVDADELLYWTSGDTQSLPELSSHLESQGFSSLQTIMLDMYSKDGSVASKVAKSQNPLEVCDRFDPTGYDKHFDPVSRTTWIKGGVRTRTFFPDNTWQGPALNKTPLVLWRKRQFFLQSAHKIWPRALNRQSGTIDGVLLHFKFTATSADQIAAPVSRAEHTTEYDAYNLAYKRNVTIDTRNSEKFVAVQSAEDAGIIGFAI